PWVPVVKVPVTQHYKTATCAKDPDCPTNQYFSEPHATAYIKMSVEKKGNVDVLCGSLVGVGCMSNCPPEKPVKVCQPLELPIDKLDAGTPTLVGIAFSDESPARVALRFDFSNVPTGPNGEPTFFSQAFATKTQNLLYGDFFKPAPSSDVSLSIGQKLLRGKIKNQIVEAL